MQHTTTKVVMIVDSVSPTPFALLRRAKNFEYRDDDEALQAFSSYDDTVKALTDECRRVLECISTANQSVTAVDSVSQDPSWSRFEDLGFSGILDSPALSTNGSSSGSVTREFSSMKPSAHSRTNDFGRPTTPSWADFLSSGFPDENNNTSALLSPSVKLPPLGDPARVKSSQSHVRHGMLGGEELEPGELASITHFDLDDTFWWVWMTSLAPEETTDRKAAFGRCTLIETRIPGAKWLVVEEQIKGASPGPEEGAYIAEKKSMFSWTRRGRLGRRKSTGKKPDPSKEPYNRTTSNTPMSKTSIGPDQHARVQAAAAKLAQNQKDREAAEQLAQRRARMDDTVSTKTNSVLTLQPHLLSDAGLAMKWDKKFGEGAKDRDVLRAQYLGNVNAGKGSKDNLLRTANGNNAALARNNLPTRDLPALPKSEAGSAGVAPHSPAPDAIDPHVGASEQQQPLPPAALDDKAAPALDQHPALRQAVPERKPVVPRPSEEHTPAQDAKKPSPKKLKKKEGGGGFRKLFGKKKVDAPAAQTDAEEDARMHALDAARSISRVEDHGDTPREPSPAASFEKPLPVRAMSPELQPSPALSAISATHREPALQVVPTPNVHEQQQASTAFSRFDQGPIDDMPAFVPEDSDDDDSMPSAPHYAPPLVPEQHMPAKEAQFTDNISEESVDYSRPVAAQDRWAQIRRNAAERAVRVSEEQSRRSHSQSVRTDEGETSGEETIESRVARIKARVAELTGNVEGQSPSGVVR